MNMTPDPRWALVEKWREEADDLDPPEGEISLTHQLKLRDCADELEAALSQGEQTDEEPFAWHVDGPSAHFTCYTRADIEKAITEHCGDTGDDPDDYTATAMYLRPAKQQPELPTPPGMVLVPREPTEAMLEALHDEIGHEVQVGLNVDDNSTAEVSILEASTLPDAYRAMLAAAPAAQVAANCGTCGETIRAHPMTGTTCACAAAPAAVVDEAIAVDISEVLSAFDKAASIAQRHAGNIDAIEERGGEDADDPMEAIHFILHSAYHAWKRTYGRQQVSALTAALGQGVGHG